MVGFRMLQTFRRLYYPGLLDILTSTIYPDYIPNIPMIDDDFPLLYSHLQMRISHYDVPIVWHFPRKIFHDIGIHDVPCRFPMKISGVILNFQVYIYIFKCLCASKDLLFRLFFNFIFILQNYVLNCFGDVLYLNFFTRILC